MVLSPTLQNPTTASMSLARRERIVAIARRHDAIIVEEDVYGLLPTDAPPPLAMLAPSGCATLPGFPRPSPRVCASVT